MFGKFQPDDIPGVDAPGVKANRPEDQRGSVRVEKSERTLATYDRLGQTVVATVAVGSLSGPDAQELSAELCARMFLLNKDEAGQTLVRHVVLDFQNVQYIDSMCIGVLVELLGKLQESGGRIALVNTEHNLECLFKLTRLDRVFPMCRDVMKAIEVVERAG
ncbi:MAG: STAS domain-containing protein [Phycisphaerales bacterium]